MVVRHLIFCGDTELPHAYKCSPQIRTASPKTSATRMNDDEHSWKLMDSKLFVDIVVPLEAGSLALHVLRRGEAVERLSKFDAPGDISDEEA